MLPDGTPERGDIFWVDLGKVASSELVGSEQAGRRPVLVISPTLVNQSFPIVVVAAITTTIRRNNPLSPVLTAGKPLTSESCVMSWQVRTLSQKRLQNFAGSIDAAQQAEVDRAVAASFGLR